MIPVPSEPQITVQEDEKLDVWGNGPLRILQKKIGYRFSVDALILSDFVRIKDGERLLDLGTGCGILSLLLARANPHSTVTALELSPDLLDLADRNVALNHLSDRISLIRGDMCQIPRFLKKESFDLAVTNPPYRPLHSGRINPDPQKAMARHEIRVTLPQLIQSVVHALKVGGRWFVIYPAWRLVSLLTQAREKKLEPKRLQLVHSLADREAEWVLLEAVYQGREDLKILPPLVVYQRPGEYSPSLQKLLNNSHAPRGTTEHENTSHQTPNVFSPLP
jgi:tRNA1Val (adenine37-N6)-methyltransferase